MSRFWGRLRWRLLVGNLIVAGAGAITVAVGVGLAAPRAFDQAMGGPGGMAAMGPMMNSLVTSAFGDAVSSALILGVAAGAVVAVVVAVIISTRLARPIRDLAVASQQVASGDYAQRVPDGDGELGELAASFNEMAASLDATERRRHDLIGDVAHELRTPITSLRGYIEGLEAGVFTPGPDAWRVLQDQASRLGRLVDDLSDLWRAESNDIALTPENLDGPTLVADAVDRHRAAAALRSIELVADAGPQVRIRADRARIAQILDNLVGNALRYTPAGGRVDVSVVAGSDRGTISVRDTGPGLTPDQLTRVFERFYRVDPSRSRAAGGSGLGLAIAEALAEAMGGRIWASSPGPGAGSTFSVELPVARQPAVPKPDLRGSIW